MKRDTAGLRLPILRSFLFNVEQRYNALRQGQLPHQEWQERLVGLGNIVTVTVLEGGQSEEGVMVGVDENGALLLRRADGSITPIFAGDVTLRS
jgi:BirA family biotin operon repressor/biotin-[acetyl-CoA-carboxylase] ligase